MNFKLDIKSILLIILLSISIFIGYKWYFTIDSMGIYKSNYELLQKQNLLIEKQRDSLNKLILNLNIEKKQLLIKDSLSYVKITNLDKQIKIKISNMNNTKKDLDNIKNKLREFEDKIKIIKNQPINKNDDSLIQSLKNNLKI